MKINSVDKHDPTDLVAEVTLLLAKHGHPSPEAWKVLLPPVVFSVDIMQQRFLINRTWTRILGAGIGAVETIDARFCLVDQGPISDWLRLFESGVVPCILKHFQRQEAN